MSEYTGSSICNYASVCSGCGWINKPYSNQSSEKVQAFFNSWSAQGLPPINLTPNFISIAKFGLRDRVDLVIDRKTGNQRIGMFDSEHKEIIDLHQCPQLSPKLQAWYSDFRKISWPILRGSIRLRVSPKGDRGVWLDFANVDIKTLLDERTILESLLDQAIVEVGQRRKRLVLIENRLRLLDPVLHPWFETYVENDLKTEPLSCHIGGFTQPGFTANHTLVEEVLKLVRPLRLRKVAEFGSGIGNFTLPLASEVESIEAFEVDRLACEALEINLANAQLSHKVKVHRGDFQILSSSRTFNPTGFDGVFVDPPRSGLKQFLDPFFQFGMKPKYFLYVSCYPDSFCLDAKRLYELGYTLNFVTIVDQFPQTPHAELVVVFEQ